MRPVLDLNDVRIFAAVVDGGSMSSAAKTLGLPTSTVSRSIARLQKRLGIALIRNIKSGIVLTDAGSEYLPSCREALRLIQEGQTALTQHTEQPIGTLRVACPVAMARDVLAPLMPPLSMRHPALKVEILPYTPGPNMTSNKDSDLFFHVVPPGKQTGHMRSFPAARRGIYTSKKYGRVAGTPETPEELASFQCLGSRGVPAFAQWHLRNEVRELKLDLEFNYMAADPYTLRSLLLEGLGITMLPVWMALEEGVHEQLIRILPDWEPSPVPLVATYTQDEASVPKLRSFLDFMSEHLGTNRDPRAVGRNVADCFI